MKANCKRCNVEFTPRPTRLKFRPMTDHCNTCMARNILDGLDLPTPPELLDRFTKHPALTNKEFQEMLDKDKETL